ncbi:MAG: hypothetical protein QM809_13155 [Gordonia sp. (in: high G+C Gram-positive bacteria)]|uniref:hypothetical protein n=1 Tax=Gordonia sp. (in: high G+C Gram-positive bacteria) TaxID=84139 RepID=UPI0039E6B39E
MTTCPSYLALPAPRVEATLTDEQIRRVARSGARIIVRQIAVGAILVLILIGGLIAVSERTWSALAFYLALIAVIGGACGFLLRRYTRTLHTVLTGGAPAPEYPVSAVAGPLAFDYSVVGRSVGRLYYSTVSSVKVLGDAVIVYRGRSIATVPRVLVDDALLARFRGHAPPPQIPQGSEITLPAPQYTVVHPAAEVAALIKTPVRRTANRVGAALLVIFGVPVVIIAVIGLSTPSKSLLAKVLFFLIMLIPVTVPPLILWFMIRRQYAQGLAAVVTGGEPGPAYRFSCIHGDDHVDLALDGRYATRLPFEALSRVRVFDRTVLLYVGDVLLTVVPRELFPDDVLSGMEAAGVTVKRVR